MKLLPLPSQTNLMREQFSPRLARRGGIGIQVEGAVLVCDLRDGVRNSGMQCADEDRAVFARDEALGDARRDGRVRFGIGGDPFDLATEDAAFRVLLVDRHANGAVIVAPAVAELPAGIVGQAQLDRLALCVRMVVPPRPVEAAEAGKRRRHGRHANETTPREVIPSHIDLLPKLRLAGL
jgi:hypothetical protein